MISVIIPTYNRTESLLRAINSVFDQTYRDIEIIVVDDNADNLEVRKYIENTIALYENIIYIKNEKQEGGAISRNIGIENSRGEYIAFLDDDDEFYASKLENQLRLFEETEDMNLGMVYCYGHIVYPNGDIEIEDTSYTGYPLEEHMKCNIARTSFWLCKREVMVRIGGFEDIDSNQDGVVILKMLANGYSVDVVCKILTKYYLHGVNDGITGITEKNLAADHQYFLMCKSKFNLLEKNARKRVILNYYYNRNFNLIILRKDKECIKDLRFLFDNFPFQIISLKCLFRFFFKFNIINTESKRLISKNLA